MNSFKSKFGYSVFVFLLFVFSLIIILSVDESDSFKSMLILLILFSLIILLFLYMNFSTRYTIDKRDQLNIRMGVLYDKTIAINSIRKVRRTRSLLSSPAPSLDRLELSYGKFNQLLISPKDQAKFVKVLIELNPAIEVDFDFKDL